MYYVHRWTCTIWTCHLHFIYRYVHVHTFIWHVCTMYIYGCTCTYLLWYIHVHGIYMYVIFIYLYSTACLYNKSSEGVYLFCCFSSILGWKQPFKLQHATIGQNMYFVYTCTFSVYTCTYVVHTLYVGTTCCMPCHCILACTSFVIGMYYAIIQESEALSGTLYRQYIPPKNGLARVVAFL